MSAQPLRNNPPRNLPVPKTAPKPPGSLPADPLVLEQQRQILELQKQILELQIQQQKGTASVIEAKSPLIKMQMEDLNRKESHVLSSIENCKRGIQAYKCCRISADYPKGFSYDEHASGTDGRFHFKSEDEKLVALQARQHFTNLEQLQKELSEIQARKKALETQIQALLNTTS